jgi:hypothetical protein
MEKRREALYRGVSLSLAILFAAVGMIFLLLPGRVISFFDLLSGRLGMKLSAETGCPFFPVLGVAYMYLVTIFAWLMFRHPQEKKYPWLLAQAKGSSSLLSLGFFMIQGPFLIYLTNGIVDGFLCLLALYFYFKLRAQARTQPGSS